MLRSLFTGISGLRTHQVMMDVTGNNIANVNTNGFKASQTQFTDQLSQMLQGSSAPVGTPNSPATPADGDTAGGTNPAQVGLGVRLHGITTNYGQGSTQLTGRSTDMMLNGEGFFVVNEGGQKLYTRAGGFSFDANRTLVAPNGSKVLGWPSADPVTGGPPTNKDIAALVPIVLPATHDGTPAGSGLQSFNVAQNGEVRVLFANGQSRSVGFLAVAKFPNPGGLEKVGGSLFRPTPNSGSAGSGNPELDIATANGRGTVTTGTLEMSNVDLAQEFTNMIIAQRGFQANSKIITASDEILQELVNLKR